MIPLQYPIIFVSADKFWISWTFDTNKILFIVIGFDYWAAAIAHWLTLLTNIRKDRIRFLIVVTSR